MSDQDNKPRPRRSKHAERRARQGRRVPTAFQDVNKARASDIFVEIANDLFIVRGGKSREHIFRRDGLLVTTINSRTRASHARRLRDGTIRPATAEEVEQLKALFR